jgi:hypothetical protein
MGGIYEVCIEMGSCAMIYMYIPSFIKIGSGTQKLIGGDTQTHTAYLHFLKIRKVG